jgi:hypothetical protein
MSSRPKLPSREGLVHVEGGCVSALSIALDDEDGTADADGDSVYRNLEDIPVTKRVIRGHRDIVLENGRPTPRVFTHSQAANLPEMIEIGPNRWGPPNSNNLRDAANLAEKRAAERPAEEIIETDETSLSASEQATLADCERVVTTDLRAFLEVGAALATIRDGRLYRATHRTFAAYARDRFALGEWSAHAKIIESVVVRALPDPMLIKNESQAFALAGAWPRFAGNRSRKQAGPKLPSPGDVDAMVGVLDEAILRSDGKLTTPIIEEVVRERMPTRGKPKGRPRGSRVVVGKCAHCGAPVDAQNHYVRA